MGGEASILLAAQLSRLAQDLLSGLDTHETISTRPDQDFRSLTIIFGVVTDGNAQIWEC